jgi:hypothetical protein
MVRRSALSFVLGLGLALSGAQGGAHAAPPVPVLTITPDEAKIARVPQGTVTLVIGNPIVADVTMLKGTESMVVTGKGFGETNLIAIDAAGSLIKEEQIQVLPSRTVLVLQSGSSRMSYACDPTCMPTVQLGDDDKTFTQVGTQMSTRNGYAASGASGPAAK